MYRYIVGAMLALFFNYSFAEVASPVSCGNTCAEIYEVGCASPIVCTGQSQTISTITGGYTVTCQATRTLSESPLPPVNASFNCTGSCPEGTHLDVDTGSCKKDECTPDSPNFVGWGPDGKPKCHDEGLPDNCGYVNGHLVCWDEEDEPPEEDAPDVDPDNPPASEPPVGPGDGTPPIDPDDPSYEPPPEEGDPRLTTGGKGCEQAPRCEGDLIDCNILYQAWKDRCNAEANQPTIDIVADILNSEDSLMPTLPDVEEVESDMSSDLTSLYDDQTDSFSDFTDDIPESLEQDNNITGSIYNLNLEIFDLAQDLLPPTTGCTPVSFHIIDLYYLEVGCEYSSAFKSIFEWVLSFTTIMYVLFISLSTVNAGGKS